MSRTATPTPSVLETRNQIEPGEEAGSVAEARSGGTDGAGVGVTVGVTRGAAGVEPALPPDRGVGAGVAVAATP